MVFNPDIHHRKSQRLPGYDYSQAGAYFITLCVRDRACRLGEIRDGLMYLSYMGEIALQEWQNLPSRWPQLSLDAYVTMPNHIHGIFWLSVGAPLAGVRTNLAAQNADSQSAASNWAAARAAPTVGQVVGAYKSLVFQQCLAWAKNTNTQLGVLWQRNYWERVIRNQAELTALREYINNNPMNWELDSLHQGNKNEFKSGCNEF